MSGLLEELRGTRVDPQAQEVFKFLPSNPPCRGEHILVDGARCRVTSCRAKWNGRVWTIQSLRVKSAIVSGKETEK